MAARAHHSAAALSEAANGRKLPSLSVTRAYVGPCEGDITAWESRWRRLAAELADPTEPDGGEDRVLAAPYVGLRSFQLEAAGSVRGEVSHVLGVCSLGFPTRCAGVVWTLNWCAEVDKEYSGESADSAMLCGVAKEVS